MGQLTRNEVFTLAVQRYSDTVYRTAVHNCRCTADAEDVVQDVFEKLLHYNGIFESEEHLKAWLLRVAINRCRDLTRAAHQKDTELDENLPAPDVLAEDGSVLDAIRTLPGLDPDGLHRLAVRLTEATTGLCATLTPNEKGTGYCLARADGDVRALTKALNAALNGRGGGKPGICQGSCAASPEQVERFLKENHRL